MHRLRDVVRPARHVSLLPLVLSASCYSSLDLREIEEPMLLNHAPPQDSAVRFEHVSHYTATKSWGHMVVSAGSASSAASHDANTLAAGAFEQIGGHLDRAVTKLELGCDSMALNALLGLGFKLRIQLSGDVVEVRR